jgi:hypothetical protein
LDREAFAYQLPLHIVDNEIYCRGKQCQKENYCTRDKSLLAFGVLGLLVVAREGILAFFNALLKLLQPLNIIFADLSQRAKRAVFVNQAIAHLSEAGELINGLVSADGHLCAREAADVLAYACGGYTQLVCAEAFKADECLKKFLICFHVIHIKIPLVLFYLYFTLFFPVLQYFFDKMKKKPLFLLDFRGKVDKIRVFFINLQFVIYFTVKL